MQSVEVIASLGWMIVAAAGLLLVSRKLQIPSIITYIAAGLLVGPGLGLVDLSSVFSHTESHGPAETIGIVAEVGIALLLFLVGLELSVERIRDVGKVAVAAGLGQVVFTAAIGFFLALLLGFEPVPSLFIATALTFSSTVVVVKLLDQKNELHSLYGRIAVGIFLVQNIVVIVALTVLAGLGAAGDAESGGGGGALLPSLGIAFAGMTAMLLSALVAARWLLPRPFAWAARSPETLFIWSLCWCFLFVLAAAAVGLSREIGAFVAGVSLAQLACSHDLIRRVRPLMNFFVAVFFVTLGAQMDLSLAVDVWPSALWLSLFVLLGNPFIFMLIIARFGYGERTAFKTSVTVANISEFSFIFIAMGLTAGLVDEAVLSIVAIVGLVTIALSSYMILYSDPLYEFIRKSGVLRIFRAAQHDEDDSRPPREGHFIVVGMNTLGRTVTAELTVRGHSVLAVDTDPRKLQDLDCATLHGNIDYAQVIDEADVASARMVISCVQIEPVNNLLAWRCAQLGVPCVAHAFDRAVVAELRALDVAYLLESKRSGAERIRTQLDELGLVPR